MPASEAFFLPLARGRRFCMLDSAATAEARSGAIVFAPPFAEEMNKSRRMAALQARALAEAGWTVLRMDLFGCGDSDGEYGEAGWRQWVSDILDATSWLRQRTGRTPVLWGLRSGCLLAAEAARVDVSNPCLLLWQPVISGRQYLQQFLRLKVAGQMLAEGAAPRTGVAQLRERSAKGETVEVAGYAVSPDLAMGLEAAELAPPGVPSRVAWLEVGSNSSLELPPAASGCVDAWRAAGHRVDVRVVEGLPFWQTQEIAECTALIEATVGAVEAWRP